MAYEISAHSPPMSMSTRCLPVSSTEITADFSAVQTNWQFGINCLYAEHGDVIYPNKFLDSFHKISIQHKVLWNKARKLARRFRKYAKW